MDPAGGGRYLGTANGNRALSSSSLNSKEEKVEWYLDRAEARVVRFSDLSAYAEHASPSV